MKPPKTILLVDDDNVTHELFEHYLGDGDFHLLHNYDGVDVHLQARARRPDLILLDINMPRDGRDICRDLKRETDTRDIPVVIVTGRDDELDRRIGLELGADEYIVKPVSRFYLKHTIHKVLRKKEDDIKA